MLNQNISKVRETEHTDNGSRVLIGRGGDADVFRYLDGPFKGRASRVEHRIEHDYRVLYQNSLLRFRRHQIAYELFPENTLNVIAVDITRKEMWSHEVVRSKDNLRCCTKIGIKASSRKEEPEISDAAKEIAERMNNAGIYPNRHFHNISELSSGEITFFEIENVDCKIIEKNLTLLNTKSNERLRTLLYAYKLEDSLDAIDIYDLYSDEDFRKELLESHPMGLNLTDFYRDEAGQVVRI